jgi:hypothetical protein
VHPFRHHDVEINLHNGLDLVYAYVSKNTKTMGFSPKDNFTWNSSRQPSLERTFQPATVRLCLHPSLTPLAVLGDLVRLC